MKIQPLDATKFNLKLILDLGYEIKSNRKVRIALFECPICNKQFKTSIRSAYKSKKCKSCAIKENNTKHGLSYERKYHIWYEIIQRCYNKNHAFYHCYGLKNISIFDLWKDNPKLFIEYINSLENVDKKGYSLDRINNNGNYEPGNLRWTDSLTQSHNSKHGFFGKSKYVGVVLQQYNSKWKAILRYKGKAYHLGIYEDEIQAAIAYDNKIDELQLTKLRNKDVYPDDFV